jgi:hypothetical protein
MTLPSSDVIRTEGVSVRIATSAVSQAATEQSVDAALDLLVRRLGGEPDLVIAYHTADGGAATFEVLGRRMPPGRFAGCSSCRGVMTEEGLFGFDGPGFALWGLRDPDGAYGTGFATIDLPPDADHATAAGTARDAARRAYLAAVEGAGRAGELPELLWVLAVPGVEEAVLRGLDDVTGGQVPIAGGSAADNTIEGGWTCFAGDRIGSRGVAVVALFPTTAVASSFQSGYEPAGPSGVVTRCEGRLILELDGRPAAQVYDEWTRGRLASALAADGGNVLSLTTMSPLGREIGRISVDQQSIAYYSLLHPERVTATHGLTLFAEVTQGERLHLMQGSIDSLVSRAGRVADAARSLLVDGRRGRAQANPAGGLVIYCAGCMLAVGDDLPRVAKELTTALSGTPFIGAFTFGEQGCLLGGENRHGNLMISVAVFER